MNLGGVANLLIELHRGLEGSGISHTLVTGICASNEIDILENLIPDKNIVKIQTMGRALNPVADIRTFIGLRKIMKDLKPDVVHTHTSKAGFLGRLAACSIRLPIKVVHTYHGHHFYGYFSRFFIIVICLIEKMLASVTDLFVADSKQVKLDLIDLGIGKDRPWVIIPPGIVPGTLLPKSLVREHLQISADTFVVCWIGRFTHIKNPMLALETFKHFVGNGNSQSLMIMVGDGELLKPCKNFAAVNNLQVKFIGWSTDLSYYLSSSDVLLLTSKNEGFGMVIAEAGYFGLPAVSTDVGGVREFISDGKNGLLSESNIVDLSRSLKILYYDKEMVTRLGKNAKKTTMENFLISNFVEMHESIYKNLVS